MFNTDFRGKRPTTLVCVQPWYMHVLYMIMLAMQLLCSTATHCRYKSGVTDDSCWRKTGNTLCQPTQSIHPQLMGTVRVGMLTSRSEEDKQFYWTPLDFIYRVFYNRRVGETSLHIHFERVKIELNVCFLNFENESDLKLHPRFKPVDQATEHLAVYKWYKRFPYRSTLFGGIICRYIRL